MFIRGEQLLAKAGVAAFIFYFLWIQSFHAREHFSVCACVCMSVPAWVHCVFTCWCVCVFVNDPVKWQAELAEGLQPLVSDGEKVEEVEFGDCEVAGWCDSPCCHHMGLRPLSGPLYSHLRGLQMEGPRCHYLQPEAPNLGFEAHRREGKIRLDLTCTQAGDLDKCEVPAARG